jgi:hypothetical protein
MTTRKFNRSRFRSCGIPALLFPDILKKSARKRPAVEAVNGITLFITKRRARLSRAI